MQKLIRFSDIMKLWVPNVKGGWIKNFLLESRRILLTFLCPGMKVDLEKRIWRELLGWLLTVHLSSSPSLRRFNCHVQLINERRDSWKPLWKNGGGGKYKLYCYVTVIEKWLTRLYYVEDWRNGMFLFTNLSKIFLQEHFRVTAAKPLRQSYLSLILARVYDNYFFVLTDATIVLIEPSYPRREVAIDRYHQWKG